MLKNKILLAAFISFFALLLLQQSHSTFAAGELIKGSLPGVYYVTAEGKRLVFPNKQTYFSWYPDFSGVQTITDSQLAQYPLAGNVTMRPGVKMIKIMTDSRVYAVAEGGILRWISTEALARSIYGTAWNKQIVDVPDAFFVNYQRGTDITGEGAGTYSPAIATNNSPTVDLEYNRTQVARNSLAPNITPAGCDHSNPACAANQNCVNNACVLKPGCTYDNPACGTGFACVNNSCVLAVAPLPDPCAEYVSSPAVPSTLQYVVLTRPLFTAALQPFVASKANAGVYLVDQISCTVPGGDIQEKMRNFLRSVKTAAPAAKYVLLVGTPDPDKKNAQVTSLGEAWEVPIRYIATIGDYSYSYEPTPTDQYFATVDTNWPANDLSWAADFDFHPNFFVGRVPVKTAAEVQNWVAKTTGWSPPAAPRHSLFVSAYCASQTPLQPSFDLLSRLTHRIVYHNCSSDSGGDIADLSTADQADLVTSMSHGNYTGITKWPAATGYDLSVGGSGFPQKHPVMYVHGCNVAGMDYPDKSLGQDLIGRTDGVTAFIGATRSHWDIDFPFWQSVFLEGNLTVGEALYNTKYIKASRVMLPLREVDNMFMFNLLGDPALAVVRPGIVVSRESVDVPQSSFQQNGLSLTARISSALNETVSGELRLTFGGGGFSDTAELTALPPNAAISLEGGPWGYSQTQDIDDAAGTFSFPKAIGFTGCDTARMSCVASRVVVRATLPIQCGRPSVANGVKTMQVRFRGNAASVRIVLKETPGYYCAEGVCPAPAAAVLAEKTVDAYDGMTTNLIWTQSPASEPMPTGQWTGSYSFAYFKVEATDAQGTVIGSCDLNSFNEPTDKIL